MIGKRKKNPLKCKILEEWFTFWPTRNWIHTEVLAHMSIARYATKLYYQWVVKPHRISLIPSLSLSCGSLICNLLCEIQWNKKDPRKKEAVHIMRSISVEEKVVDGVDPEEHKDNIVRYNPDSSAVSIFREEFWFFFSGTCECVVEENGG